MKQVLVLTRMQLGSALEFINIRQKKNRKKNLSVFTILILGCALFGFISGSYSYAMGMALKQAGELELLPGFFMAATCLIILLTSIYKAKGVLFGFKDYDIVMSLPVKASYIVASRLLLLYTIDMVFVIGFLVPCYAVYGMLAAPSIGFYVYGGIALLFVPLIPMIIASIIGVILGYISSKFKYSNAVNTIVIIAAFMALFFGMMTLQNSGDVAKIGSTFSDKMNSMYPLAKWFQDGVVGNDVISMVLFLCVSALTFFIFSLLLGKCFKSLNSKLSAMHAGRKFKMKELRQSSQLVSLIKKEAKRYFSCTIYVFNTSFSLILMIIGAVAIQVVPIKQLDEMLEVPEVLTMMKIVIPFAIAFMVAMVAITASSISLEGKNFWILKAAPVKADTIFLSKILFSICLTMPVSALTSISIMIRLQLNLFECVVMLLLPLVYCYLTAVLGLFINLKLPLMEWKNETVVVKQSAASIIGTLSAFFTVGIPAGLLFLLKQVDSRVITIATLMVAILISTSLHTYMAKHGEKMIADL